MENTYESKYMPARATDVHPNDLTAMLKASLDYKIPREVVKERDGGNGRKLAYLEGHYVIARLNEVFGQENWAYASELKQVCTDVKTLPDRYGKDRYYAAYIAHVRIKVEFPNGKTTEYTDVGYGDGFDATNPGKAHESATKEAVTDGIKRCAKNLGMSMGLALYDKTQENVENEPEEVPNVAAKAAPNKSDLITKIKAAADLILARRPEAKAELLTELKDVYGVSKSDDLTADQASKFLDSLRKRINSK